MLYHKLNQKLATGKPVAMCIMPRNFKKMKYIMGFSIPILEYLSEKYDLVLISGKEGENEDLYKYGQVWGLDQSYLLKLKKNKFKRATELEDDNWVYNRNILYNEFLTNFEKGYFKNLEKILIFDPIDFILPLTSYIAKKDHDLLYERRNEFHDSINPDDIERLKIEETNQKVCEKFDSRCSILAFGTHFKNLTVNLVKYSFKESDNFKMTYAFINDPAFYCPIFKHENIPFTAYYFKNDNRGTRDFKSFPLGELQHIVWDNINMKKSLFSSHSKKDFSIFFAGTIFQEKGGRIELWEKYLKDLRIPKAGLYIPLRSNGILHSKSTNDRYLNKVKESFDKLHKEVINHPHYTGHLIPDDYEDEIQKYKYGLIFRCVSYYDSLNFRPILYARLRILPFLDPEYDPACLQIPRYIQSKITIHSHKDIEDKVKYFDENPSEREQILDQLEEIFNTKTFNKNWKSDLSNYL